MKACDYCGKENEDTSVFCVGCGTTLNVPDEIRAGSLPTSASKDSPRTLNARIATIILLVYLATQFFCGYSMDAVAGQIAATQRIRNPQQVSFISEVLNPTGVFLGFVLSGIVIVVMTSTLIPKQLKDTGPHGAAWVPGRWDAIVKGLIIGLIIGVCDQTFILIAKHYATYRNLDSFNRMAVTPGLQQYIWVLVSVLLAPPVEEMMFRGVLYGGYRKSFGPFWAAVLTTFLFVVLHLPSYVHLLSNVIGIVGATLATLWCRLHWKAIGPAIAVHFGYNFMAVLTVVYKTWH